MWALLLFCMAFPIALILAWERLFVMSSRAARIFYRVTGLIGAPVHELAHVTACVLFRMPITKVVLFQPSAPGGRLGYVSFRYNPRSGFHAVGRLIQGIAPLMIGAWITKMALGLNSDPPPIGAPATDTMVLLASTVGQALKGLVELATSGFKGAALCIGVVAVCIHAIPSIADVRIGLTGLASVLVALGGLLAILLLFDAETASSALLNNLSIAAQFFLWKLSCGIASVGAVSIIGTGVLIVLPNLCYTLARQFTRTSPVPNAPPS